MPDQSICSPGWETFVSQVNGLDRVDLKVAQRKQCSKWSRRAVKIGCGWHDPEQLKVDYEDPLLAAFDLAPSNSFKVGSTPMNAVDWSRVTLEGSAALAAEREPTHPRLCLAGLNFPESILQPLRDELRFNGPEGDLAPESYGPLTPARDG